MTLAKVNELKKTKKTTKKVIAGVFFINKNQLKIKVYNANIQTIKKRVNIN